MVYHTDLLMWQAWRGLCSLDAKWTMSVHIIDKYMYIDIDHLLIFALITQLSFSQRWEIESHNLIQVTTWDLTLPWDLGLMTWELRLGSASWGFLETWVSDLRLAWDLGLMTWELRLGSVSWGFLETWVSDLTLPWDLGLMTWELRLGSVSWGFFETWVNDLTLAWDLGLNDLRVETWVCELRFPWNLGQWLETCLRLGSKWLESWDLGLWVEVSLKLGSVTWDLLETWV